MWARWLWPIFLVAGCDRVFGLVGPLDQRDARDEDQNDGGQQGRDAEPPDAFACSFSREDFVVSANAWTPSAQGNAAVLVDANNVIKFASGSAQSVLSLDSAAYGPTGLSAPATFTAVTSPTLSSDGAQIFVRLQRADLTATIGRSARQNTTWDPITPLDVLDAADAPIDLSFTGAPSAVTATTPRRMLLRLDVGLVEIVEETATAWRIVHIYAAADLGLAALTDGNLTSDGKAVVVTGRDSAMTPIQIFRMERSSVDDIFAAPQTLYQSESTLRSPYLGENCILTFLALRDVYVAR